MSHQEMEHTGSALEEIIRGHIHASPLNAIRFRDYMQLCLYEPQYGYYMKERKKIGREGDFYTSSHIGSVLGQALATFITKQASTRPNGAPFTIAEWGAGTGRLASQILDAIAEEEPLLYESIAYCIMETSPYHRAMQEQTLVKHQDKLSFIDPHSGDETPYPLGVVLSNELLDAFPVHRLRRRGEELMELYVTWAPDHAGFREVELPCSDPRLTGYLEAGSTKLLDGQTVDISLEAAGWLEGQVSRLSEAVLITIDYGADAKGLFGSHRMSGTLMCYKDHIAYDNPYIYAGEQDITAHVDFSGCIRAGIEAGAAQWRYMTQKEFLLQNGVLERLVEHDGRDPFSASARQNRAIRQLLLTDKMSELFKVLIQWK
jgi:SAM-dependent MidA family methyltransferase